MIEKSTNLEINTNQYTQLINKFIFDKKYYSHNKSYIGSQIFLLL